MSNYIHTRPVKDGMLRSCLEKQMFPYLGPSGSSVFEVWRPSPLTNSAVSAAPVLPHLSTPCRDSEVAVSDNEGEMFPVTPSVWPPRLPVASPGASDRCLQDP